MNVPLALAALQKLPIENNNRFLRGGNIFDCLLKKAEPSDLPDILAIIEDGRRTLQKWHSPMAKRRWPESRNFSKDIDRQTCYILMVDDALASVGVLCSEIDPAYEAIFNGSWQPHSQATYTAIHL